MRLHELCIVLGSALIAQADETKDIDKLAHTVKKVEKLPNVKDAWDSAMWQQAATLSCIAHSPLAIRRTC